jgi:hypothetical protein
MSKRCGEFVDHLFLNCEIASAYGVLFLVLLD